MNQYQQNKLATNSITNSIASNTNPVSRTVCNEGHNKTQTKQSKANKNN